MVKYGWWIPILLSAVVLTGACAKTEDPYGGTVVLSSLTEPEGLNPLIYRDSVSNHVGAMIFNKLIWLNEQMEPNGDLAESWEVSENGLLWTFHIREGVRFHDGAELTAEDCAFTFNAVRDPDSGSPMAQFFGVISDVRASGPHTLQITLKEPYAPLTYLLIMEILPSHLFEGGSIASPAFEQNPVGSGPFRFVEWKENEIILEAYEDYYEGRPYLDRVVLRFFSDKRIAWSELMRGSVDVVLDLEPEDYRVIEGDARFNVYEYLEVFYYTVLFNLRDPLFADPKMREAVDLALDRRDIIENALDGWAVPTTGPFLPGTWPYNADVPEAEYDPEGAAALLRSLGWADEDGDLIREKDGEELTLSLLVDGGDLLKEAVAQRIKWQLFQVGVRVETEFLDPQRLFQERLMPGDFQGVVLQFNASGDPDKFTFLFWHSSQIGRSNLGAYGNAETDRLVEQGRIETDPAERRRIYRRIHEIVSRDRPAAFLFCRRRLGGASADIRNVQVDPKLIYRSVKDWQVDAESNTERR